MKYKLGKHARQKSRTGAHANADDWLMTYADMITLLLCFFAIFLAIEVPKKAAITTSAQIAEGLGAPDFIAKNNPLEKSPNIVVPTGTQIGDRVTALQVSSSAFFETGSADLTDEGRKILKDEAAILRGPEYSRHIITVEGHTDDMPVTGGNFKSNWELSAARASAVVHFLLDQGIEPFKLRAAGYADAFPRAPNLDARGNPIPANQAKNRRVVIKVEKLERAD